MDDKTEFVLKLEGKKNKGHLHYWSQVDGEVVGLEGPDDTYTLVARQWGYTIHEDYVVGMDNYYTLGEECEHEALVSILQNKSKHDYDPDDGMGHEPYKCWD